MTLIKDLCFLGKEILTLFCEDMEYEYNAFKETFSKKTDDNA